RFAALSRGEVPFYEPGLGDLVDRQFAAKRLQFSTDLGEAVAEADIVFLAVGTPSRRGDGHADLTQIYSAVEEVAPHLSGITIIATNPTGPVAPCRSIHQRRRELRPDADVAVCSNPEFLREGSALQDFMHPDRILVGCDDEAQSRDHAEALQAAGPAQ